MTSGKKKVVIGFILVFLIMLACLTIFRYIFIKSHIVHFGNAQVELVVRQELRRIGNASYDKNIMTWDVDKIKKLGFVEFDEIVPLPEDISDLKKLKNLESLSIHSLNSKTKNLNILAELPKLKKLNINKMVKQNDQGEWIEIPIENLYFLSGAPSLEELVVSFKGEDISALKDMKTLKHLDIWGGEFKDISILASLSNLETLEARNNSISDITPLMGLEHLVYAGLKDNPVAKDESYKELWKILNERRKKAGMNIMNNEEVGIQ
jgi:Leucine-rich repeat (LRR) protein